MTVLSEIAICDMALSRIGITRQLTNVDGTVASCTDQSLDKQVCLQWYERCRNRVLEAIPWTFARGYVTLVQTDDGDGEIWEDEWDLAYAYPSDCARLWRFVTDVGSWSFGGTLGSGMWYSEWIGEDAWRYVMRLHAGKRVVLTDVQPSDADVEYTLRITDPELYTEEFASALAWCLAAEITTPLMVDDKRRGDALQMYAVAMQQAFATNANEENVKDQHDGEFIKSRWLSGGSGYTGTVGW